MLKRYPEIQGPLMEILKLSSKSADDLIRRKVLDDMVARVSLSVDKARLVELLAAMKGPLEVYHHMTACSTGLSVSFKALNFLSMLGNELQEQYVANIMLLCDVEDLAVDTMGQSTNPRHVSACTVSCIAETAARSSNI